MRKLTILAVITLATASPLLVADNYITEFKSGIDTLKKEAHEHQFKEENYDPSRYNETEALSNSLEYDFIIIGAGASGSVIANRLSEIPEWKILLLEAGVAETPYTQIPSLCSLLQNTDYNWGYVTTPQKNWCKGMINNQCAIAGGKALGGSTSINGMVFTRGNARDFDQWADLGNDGWCYDDVLPYFKKSEDADLKEFDHKYHNHGGPLHIENPQYHSHILNHILAAGNEVGLETIDYNGKTQNGIGILQTNSKHGKRQSTAQAYLEPAKKRPNLTIKPLSHVTKINIAPHTKEATGVQYLHDGHLYIAKAAKEVIVSAGAINTPQILSLSGIGPREELEKLEIPCIQDLQVGENFRDHVGFLALDFLFNQTEESDPKYDQVLDYLKHGKGPLTSPGTEALAFVQTSKNSTKQPDIELFFYSKVISGTPGLNPFRIKDEVYETLWKPVENRSALNIGVMLAHPKSSGTIKLKDKDPLHLPLVNPNQFSDPADEDLNTMLAGIHKAISIVNTEPLRKLGVEINEHQVAGCEGHKWGSDDYWKCAIAHLSVSLRHVSGTAKMGPGTDKSAVVDNELRIHGLHKIRVADASVIPVTITGHTMATAIMIGEKASDLIKKEWVHA